METNLAILIGNLGNDAKTFTKNDRTFTTFSMATSDRRKNKDGKFTTFTEWHRCIVFGPACRGRRQARKGHVR